MTFKVTVGKTARNPVARAIARAKLNSKLDSAKMRILMLDAGQDDSEYLLGIMQTLATICRAAEVHWAGQEMGRDTRADYQVLKGGLSALESVYTCWSPPQAIAVVEAIDRAQALNPKLHTAAIAQAAREMGMLIQELK